MIYSSYHITCPERLAKPFMNDYNKDYRYEYLRKFNLKKDTFGNVKLDIIICTNSIVEVVNHKVTLMWFFSSQIDFIISILDDPITAVLYLQGNYTEHFKPFIINLIKAVIVGTVRKVYENNTK